MVSGIGRAAGGTAQPEGEQVGVDRTPAAEVALSVDRSDNSVKNHYHSRLRRALRKINRCISDQLGSHCKLLKINMLSRIIQAAEGYYCEGASEEAARAYSKDGVI